MRESIVFFTILLISLYSLVAIIALFRARQRGIPKYLESSNDVLDIVTSVITILGIPLVVSMLIALPEIVVPLSKAYEVCQVCGSEVQGLFKEKIPVPSSCPDCVAVNQKEAPPGYVFVISMIIIFITLELSQLDAVKGDVRKAWSALLMFSLVLDALASAILIVAKYDQYNEMTRVYTIGGLAFLASFLVIVLSRIDLRKSGNQPDLEAK